MVVCFIKKDRFKYMTVNCGEVRLLFSAIVTWNNIYVNNVTHLFVCKIQWLLQNPILRH